MTMTNNEINFRRDVLLTFQVALLGMILPSLRGVTVGWDDDNIVSVCLYDCKICDDEDEITSDIEAEIMASFPDHKVSVTPEKYAYPNDLNIKTLKAWVYRRKE